jgi:hypothetical protein
LKDQIMSVRFIACLAAALSIFLSGTLFAQDQGSIQGMKQLQDAISIINMELKADLDQILMLEEAVKVNARPSLDEQRYSPDPVLHEDVAEAQPRSHVGWLLWPQVTENLHSRLSANAHS